MDNLNLLEPGITRVYCQIIPGIIEEIAENNKITVRLDTGGIVPASIESIFLCSEHVIKASELVSKKYAEFEDNILVKNKVINPGISVLFKKHWKLLCDAENDQKVYKNAMKNFNDFTFALEIALEDAEKSLIDRVPLFNIFPAITGID